MGLRDKLRRLERKSDGELDALFCEACGEHFRVAADTDLGYLAYEWCRQTGTESYRETPPGVLRLAEHPCGTGSLVYEKTGGPWPEMLNRPTTRMIGADDGAWELLNKAPGAGRQGGDARDPAEGWHGRALPAIGRRGCVPEPHGPDGRR